MSKENVMELQAQADRTPNWLSRHTKDIIFLCLLQIALGLIYTKTVPRFYADEIWEASIATRFANEGSFSHGVIEGWGGMHINFLQNQVTQPLFCAFIFKIFGFSIFASRFASVLISLLGVAAIYKIMLNLYKNRHIAIAVVLAVMFNPWFFQASRRVRPEIFYISFSMLFMYFLLTAAKNKSLKRVFLAGLFAGLSGLSHPNGLTLCFCIGVSILIWLRPKPFISLAAILIAGFFTVVLPYIIYVYQACKHPEVSFLGQMHGGNSVADGSLLTLAIHEVDRWKRFFQWPKGSPLAAIYILAFIAAWIRSQKANKIIATTISIMAVLLMFSTVNSTASYLISLLPFLSALMIMLFYRLWKKAKDKTGFVKYTNIGLVGLFIAVYSLFCLGGISLMIVKLHDADIDRFTDRIAMTVGPDKKVYGNIILQTGKEQGKFNYGPFPSNTDWSQPISMIKAKKFDYAIRLAWPFQASYGISTPPMEMPAYGNGTIDRVCKHFGTKVDEFRDPYFGPVEIYQLDWNKPQANDPKILDKPTLP